jgi:hypothetical protein
MMRPAHPRDIGRVALGAVFVTHPELYDFPNRLADEWWHLLGQLTTAPADDVDLVWARLVELSELLCEAPARPSPEPTP